MERLSAFVGRRHEESRETQLISGDGELNETGLKEFIKSVKFHNCNVSYVIVAIMGPQSSGKSTLLNHLFHTKFKEMDTNSERSQTTKGIWIAKALDMQPFTMVMDLEGTDGGERGQDDTLFEKQSALFALAVAHIVLINIWCHDIGREHAANRPLLKTIFEVILRLFSHRRTTLLFVIRDKTKSPFDILKSKLTKDVNKIWDSVPKPEEFQGSRISDFFKVEVIALPNYELQEDQFKEQVVELRNKISNSISPGGLAGDRRNVVPASAFSLKVQNIWKTIKQNKDIHLPALEVMVASVRCEEIAKEKLSLFASDEAWLDIQEAAATKIVLGFGTDISSILRNRLLEYDSETKYFEEGVRNEKRQYLESEATRLVHPAYMKTLSHLRSEALQIFESGLQKHLSSGRGFADSVRICRDSCVLDFDRRCKEAVIEQAKWDADASAVRKELLHDIKTQTLLVRTEKLPHVQDQCREWVSAKLNKQLNTLFEMGGEEKDIKWEDVRSILKRESDAAAKSLSSALVAFELEQAEVGQMVEDIKRYATKLVVSRFNEEARNVQKLMTYRFLLALKEKDTEKRAEGEGPYDSVRRKCLKILSTMAIIRLDETYDHVDNVIFSTLMDTKGAQDPLASDTWEEVPRERTLITPAECKDNWDKFESFMQSCLSQSKVAEEKFKESNHWSLPNWVTVGLVALGVGGFIFLLRVTNIDLVLFVAELAELGLIIAACLDCIEAVIKELKEAFTKFYNAVKGLFDYVVEIVAQI